MKERGSRIRKSDKLRLDTDELRGKQSVRTTFKLREKSINLLKISAKHLGIKQKTLLDQLLEDRKALELLADDALSHYQNEDDCRPKTFVLSQNALDLTEEISSRHDIARDILVELSISRLVSYMDSLADNHDKRRQLMKEIDRYNSQLEDLLIKADSLLKKEDPFLIKAEKIMIFVKRSAEDMRKTIKNKDEFVY